MAVITRYIVVRDGVELDQVFTDKKEAEAYDKMLDAAQELSALIKGGDLPFTLEDQTVEALCVYLAKNAPAVTNILKTVKLVQPAKQGQKEKAATAESTEEKKKPAEPKARSKSKPS